MNSEFDPPPKGLSILAHAGGLVTAVVALASLEYWSSHLSQTYPKPNSQAIATSIPRSPSPMPLVESEVENALDQKVEQKAAACKFDQSLTPNRSVTFELKTFSFYSKAMGQTRIYGLILPPGYNTHSQQSYPVIFLLHGGHGDAGGWQACGAVTEVLYKLYSRGKSTPSNCHYPRWQ